MIRSLHARPHYIVGSRADRIEALGWVSKFWPWPFPEARSCASHIPTLSADLVAFHSLFTSNLAISFHPPL